MVWVAALHTTGHCLQTDHGVSAALGPEGSSEEAEGRLELLVSTEVQHPLKMHSLQRATMSVVSYLPAFPGAGKGYMNSLKRVVEKNPCFIFSSSTTIPLHSCKVTANRGLS